MFPRHHDQHATATTRRPRRMRGPLILAVSASLLGATAITTSVDAANSGTNANQAVHQHTNRTTNAVAQAAPVPLTGTVNGAPIPANAATFTVQRFEQHRGTLYAVGLVKGTLGGKTVSKRISMPVQSASNDAATSGLTAPHGLAAAPAQTAGACSILNLTLAPLDLNLLGLHVHLDQVHLLIEAIPGAGALLGNLLCSVAGLLDGGLLGGQLSQLLSAITGLLNGLLGAL
jgi:hypothetical protein